MVSEKLEVLPESVDEILDVVLACLSILFWDLGGLVFLSSLVFIYLVSYFASSFGLSKSDRGGNFTGDTI